MHKECEQKFLNLLLKLNNDEHFNKQIEVKEKPKQVLIGAI